MPGSLRSLRVSALKVAEGFAERVDPRGGASRGRIEDTAAWKEGVRLSPSSSESGECATSLVLGVGERAPARALSYGGGYTVGENAGGVPKPDGHSRRL